MPELTARFESLYGAKAAARVEAPGRVNLMGDHIDYNGLSVLPMALRQRVTLLLRPQAGSVVRIASTAPGFGPREFAVDAHAPPFPAGDWANYALAAVRELVPAGRRRGFDALVHSDIPVAAGLSSSSALVVAFALAYLNANGLDMEPLALAARMADAERFVGTRGGGMDQAICLGAREGSACRIDFDPLRLHCFAIPADWVFLVAFSGLRAEKSGAARAAYNARTVECRHALATVNAALGNTADVTWRQLLATRAGGELLDTARRVLDDMHFRRFRHVLTEAARVRQCEGSLAAASFADFGRYLTASHASLANDCEVSIPELDRLVESALEAGAAGARLTGAGFGGCVVALSTKEEAGHIREALLEERRLLRESDAEDAVFVAQPGAGASVTLL